MDFSNFIAGKKQKQSEGKHSSYDAFIPNLINIEWTWSNPQINTLLEEASHYLAKLDAISNSFKAIDLYIKMHIAKESYKSNRIEGTQTTFEQALMKKEMISEHFRDDWQEVNNYIEALSMGIEKLKSVPMSSRLIKYVHKHMLKGVRGFNKQPGNYRKSQNWIGGASILSAFFVPPPHHEVNRLMSDLEKFINNIDIHVPMLIRIAIAHYQFETIHPFLDGNGRCGRLLIILYLVEKQRLSKPVLYMSDFFETNRSSYYEALTIVREKNDMEHWILFFLTGVIQSAKNGINVIERVRILTETIEKKILLLRNYSLAKQVLNHFITTPISNTKDLIDYCNISASTASLILKEFENLNIIVEVTGNKRNRVYKFVDFLSIFQ